MIDPGSEAVLASGIAERLGTDQARLKLVDLEHAYHEEVLSETDHRSALLRVIAVLSAGQQFDVKAIGHRMVHGGEYFREAAAINDTVIRRIEDLADLAPLHNPPAAQGIRIAAELFPYRLPPGTPHSCVSLRDSLRILRKVSDPPLWISRDEPSFCRA